MWKYTINVYYGQHLEGSDGIFPKRIELTTLPFSFANEKELKKIRGDLIFCFKVIGPI